MANYTEFTPEKREKFLIALGKMPNISSACRQVGIARHTAYNHRKTDAEFKAAWDDAIEIGVDALEEVAMKRAKKESDTLLIFLLKAHRPEKYRERVEQQHSGEIAVRVTRSADIED